MYSYSLFAIILAAIIFGIAGAMAKVLFQANIPPIELTAIRTITACIIFLLFALISNRKAFFIKKANLLLLIGVSIAFTMVNITFYLAISLTTVAAAITLEYTAPFFILIIELITFNRKLSLLDIIIVSISVIGCLLLTGSGEDLILINHGVLYGLACGLSFAIYNMLGSCCQKRNIKTSSITLYSFLFSSLFWFIALPFLNLSEITYTNTSVMQILFIAVFATILPYWLLMFGLKNVGALPSTIIGMLDPLVAGIAAYFIINEVLTPLNLLGITIIILVIIASTIRDKRIASKQPKDND